jgi:23S rRNA pseudouridine2605 synthase
MARAGIASRRAAEELIAHGRVSINGHIVRELGIKADPDIDRIVVDGKPLKLPTGPSTVILLHKPSGCVTTKKDPEGRATVMDLLPVKYRHLHPIGRLDYDTSGVMLLTDDGELTQLLTHPSNGAEKVYWARVRGEVRLETVKKLETGIWLDDGKTAPCKVRVRAQTQRNALVQLTLHEGRNRQVRRMLEAVGHPVSALRRVKFAGFDLEGMAAGEHRALLPGEVHMLRKHAEKTKPHKIRAERKPLKPKTRGIVTDSEQPSTTDAAKKAVKPKSAEGDAKRFVKSKASPRSQNAPLANRIDSRWGQKTRKRI